MHTIQLQTHEQTKALEQSVLFQ